MSKQNKRQKLQHISSDRDDEASFASSDDERITNGDDAIESESVDAMDLEDDLENNDDSGNEELEDEEEDTSTIDSSTRPKTAQDVRREHGTTSSLQPRSKQNSDRVATGSNTLTMQVDRLLRKIRPKHTAREIEAEDALHMVKSTIEQLSSVGPLPLLEARKQLRKDKIQIPFPEPIPASDTNLKFAFARPASINVVGSYPIKTAHHNRKFLYIDMVVYMPSTLFQEKDYLDLRYFYKRSFYLSCIAAGLNRSHSKQFDMRFQRHHDDPLRPVITIRPQGHDRKDTETPIQHWQINILPAIAEDLFPCDKMTPNKNCIRKTRSEQTATPGYNSALRADMLVTPYLKLLHKASAACPAYKDACALGSIWLKQRGFRATPRRGGVASFEWSALLALLLTSSGTAGRVLLSNRLDCPQLFKATLQILASKDLIKSPLILGVGHDLDIGSNNGLPVIWDAVRGHNILHKCPAWAYKRLQTEAKLTLSILSDEKTNGFEDVFITRQDHDLLNNDAAIEINFENSTDLDLTKLHRVLTRGLGDRVSAINVSAGRSKPWNLDVLRSHEQKRETVRVGLLINAKNASRTIDHGPSVEEKTESEDFRQFWGEKAELRRFKDGSISEALVWESGSSKPSPIEQITSYLLRTHFGVQQDDDVVFSSDLQNRVLGTPRASSPDDSEAFRNLEHEIRSLEGLPLPIRQILLSERHCVDNAAMQRAVGPPRDVVMQFESSGRWPEDLAAIQRTKIAFLLKIHELLQDSKTPTTSRIGLENEGREILNQGVLQVVQDTGAAFNIRLFHEREQILLERRLKDRTLDGQAVDVTAMALAAYKRDYIRKPAHAQAMIQLCSRHPALATTIELLQKWLQCHVLANHFTRELIELIAARTFVQPLPWQTPNSVQTAFLRTIAWLARWDWRTEPLIVDLSSSHDLKAADIEAIRTRFQAWRQLDPTMSRLSIFAASNVDTDGATWSANSPAKVVVTRMAALANAALTQIQTQGLKLDARTLFTSSLMDFDFVLHIRASALTSRKKNRSSETIYKNLDLHTAVDHTDADFDPISDFLEDLQTVYGTAVLFFSGLPERQAIGGVWTPQTAERPWKVNLTYSTKPLKSAGDQAVLANINKSAILSEIARLGEGVVDRIELQGKP